MQNEDLIVAGLAVGAFFFLAYSIMSLVGQLTDARRRTVTKRVKALNVPADADYVPDITSRESLSSVGWLNALLGSFSFTASLNRQLRQAGIKAPLGVIVLTSGLCAMLGHLAAGFLLASGLLRIGAALLFAVLPFLWLRQRRAARMKRFQEQLPDALELITRALKSGHAFNGGLRMIGEEFTDPVGPEFTKLLDEINFGVSMDKALANLADRVDCPDLKFFTVSVNIQRETGGNLAEILESIASLIRERFRLHGRIKVLSAEGRFSALVLLLLPFVISTVIYFLNPDYMSLLWTHPVGKMMMGSSFVQLFIGTMVIRKMIRIEV